MFNLHMVPKSKSNVSAYQIGFKYPKRKLGLVCTSIAQDLDDLEPQIHQITRAIVPNSLLVVPAVSLEKHNGLYNFKVKWKVVLNSAL